MKDKFYIINLIKKLIQDFDKYLTNFPHKDIELKKEICKHGIWYYLESEEDLYERRTYVECKCIKCGIEKTFRNYEIKNIGTLIQEDHYEKCLNSYKEVVEFYNDLLGFSMDSEDVNKLMIKRFNNRKVTNK